ncbi:MAG: 4-(cytidine 5'-diphospho)-2-C-methyl-D-erythritol kinase [Leptospira sp.]|nr:4-(cytidine 5'-diphospho)-2-C-methyl-D-erythritol kinase [Leptospira sp.]
MHIFSPAKINLGLSIPYKRETDGYHQIESIFIRLDWGDDLDINWSDDSSFNLESDILLSGNALSLIEEVSSPPGWEKNLLFKTWNLAKIINPSIPGIKIRITKRIPPGGGLGGGSSNSASLWQFFVDSGMISTKESEVNSLKLGADIPFFLKKSNCWVTGIGEILEPISISKGYGVLLVPPVPLDTKTMYHNLKKSLQKPRVSKTWKEQEGSILLALERGNWASLQGILTNDFEKVAFQLHSSLEKIRDTFLLHGAEYSSMSGSGSTIFGLVQDKGCQNTLASKLQEEYPELSVVSFSF